MKLGDFPTPIDRVETPHGALWVKREDLASPIYGGNKVRRLEGIFDEARAAGKSRLVTLGAVGSHHVLATAIYGAREGFTVEAYLVAQPRTSFARENIVCALAHGLVAHAVPMPLLVRAPLRALRKKDAFYIPLGGSSLAGALACANIARELPADGDAYDWVVTACGSGGTAAGIAAGLALRAAQGERVRTRVLAVVIADPAFAIPVRTKVLASRAARALGATPRAARERLVFDRRELGRGYGYGTERGAQAGEMARALGLAVEPTYTEKSFAAALALQQREPDARILFLQTRAPTPLVSDASRTLPRAIDALLR